MRKGYRFPLALFALVFSSACRTVVGAPPLILYGGPPRPPEEIAVVQIVRTHPRWGHPTVDVRKISRIGEGVSLMFQATQGEAWSIPGHFGGPPETQNRAHSGNPEDLPDYFELLPGTYRVEYRYVPAADRWGWIHHPSGVNTTVLELKAGYVYLLEGRLDESGEGWFLSTLAVVRGGENGSRRD